MSILSHSLKISRFIDFSLPRPILVSGLIHKRTGMRRAAILATATILLIVGPLSAQTKRTRTAGKRPAAPVPLSFRFTGWVYGAPAKKLTGKDLVAYLGGAADAALQYGVKDVSVHRFRPAARTKKSAGREFAIELFRMGSPADAFGLFSIGRRNADRASAEVAAPNVTGPDRAAFVKGYVYVNIRASGCEQADVEKIAVAAAMQIGLPAGPPPPGIAGLPRSNLVPGSERFIRGSFAAGAESPLLDRDFWGFRTGTSRAFSARYAPKDSKLIVVEFTELPEGLARSVLELFKEYLEDVREEGGITAGADVAGGICLFGLSGRTAALIIGEPDPESARTRLREALAEHDDRN
jgi:hypothetical protein